MFYNLMKEEEIFLRCLKCFKVYDLRYFLNLFIMDECIFCYHKKIQSKL